MPPHGECFCSNSIFKNNIFKLTYKLVDFFKSFHIYIVLVSPVQLLSHPPGIIAAYTCNPQYSLYPLFFHIACFLLYALIKFYLGCKIICSHKAFPHTLHFGWQFPCPHISVPQSIIERFCSQYSPLYFHFIYILQPSLCNCICPQ